ncbi:MAG TPA: FAD-dependent oxidoreductase, partial [Nannocystaceae bacterium]|nr:FAD-dependent oxidoreductase [Nannocystaceae bacterium]
MLGAGAWLAAGCPGTATPSPTLAFVGQSPERGHLIRDAALRGRAPSERRRASIVIVGAGVAGLSAAWRLQRAGVRDFVVLELEDDIGGTARGGELPRSRYPMGAHYLPAPRPGFVALETLLDDLGLVVARDR